MSATLAYMTLCVPTAITQQERRLEYASAWLSLRDHWLEQMAGSQTAADIRRADARALRATCMAKAWSMIHQGKLEYSRGDAEQAVRCARIAMLHYRHARRVARTWRMA